MICEVGCVFKSICYVEFVGIVNYVYYLDVGKFIVFLIKYCIEKLGVYYVLVDVNCVESSNNGDIKVF